MDQGSRFKTLAERRAVLGLWAVPGLGPKTLEALSQRFPEGFAPLLGVPSSELTSELAAVPDVSRQVLEVLPEVPSLESLAQRVEERASEGGMELLFQGDEGYPERLCEVATAPPVLFFRGTVGAPRKRLAMVGSRHPDQGFLPRARAVALELASAGLGVVSGAAEGVDRVCHQAAVEAGQETWAFLGSALDALDPAQSILLREIWDAGGSAYSELPPGVPAGKTTFPRRNRLISGASDAVLVLRAKEKSGSIHTALYGMAQERPVYAWPGEWNNALAAGCNDLIWTGKARLFRGPADVLKQLGVSSGRAIPRPTGAVPLPKDLSSAARRAYRALSNAPQSFDDVRESSTLKSGELTSALCELEISGLCVQHPGKWYERT
jgi:DNA protecting protein DprA